MSKEEEIDRMVKVMTGQVMPETLMEWRVASTTAELLSSPLYPNDADGGENATEEIKH